MFVVVIEDQKLMREFLARLVQQELGATRVLAIGTLEELERRSGEFAGARLILFDLDLGDGNTLDWALRWAETKSPSRLVALSSVLGTLPYKRMQAAGISLIHKNDGQEDLIAALRLVLGGSIIISRGMSEVLSAGARDPRAPTKLFGPKEMQVLALLGQRMRNEDIAEVLGCSAVTVADHRKRIMQKLSVHHIEEVIDYAIRHGVVFLTPPKAS